MGRVVEILAEKRLLGLKWTLLAPLDSSNSVLSSAKDREEGGVRL